MCEIVKAGCLLFLLYCAVIDIKYREIPVILLAGFSVALLISQFLFGNTSFVMGLGGALVGGGFLIFSMCSREALGYADSWLILLLGICAGLWSVLYMVMLAFVFSAIAAGICMLRFHWSRNKPIPFIPFLALSYLGVMFF